MSPGRHSPDDGAFPRSRFDLARGRVVFGDEESHESLDGIVGENTTPEAEQLERDEATLGLYSGALRDSLAAVIPYWIEQSVVERATSDRTRGTAESEVRATAQVAGERALADALSRMAGLFGTDIERQVTTPLEILRAVSAHATAALLSLGVAAVDRDPVDVELHPDDLYGLVPASLAEIDPALAEVGVRWGAAKAHVHLLRRRLT